MFYYAITNAIPADGKPLLPKHLELFGYSTKSVDDPEKIGNKGLGLKQSIPNAVKNDLDMQIASHDSKGPFLVSFSSRMVDEDVNERLIFYHYLRMDANREMRTVDFRSPLAENAFKDFFKPIGDDGNPAFPVIREVIVNAYDEDRHFTVATQPEVGFVNPNFVTVFLAQTPDVFRVMLFRDRYFKFPIGRLQPQRLFESVNVGSVYPKSEEGVTRLFVQGVMVFCDKGSDVSSVYDYDVVYKYLVTEDRNLSSMSTYKSELSRVFEVMADEKILKTILDEMCEGRAKFELDVLGKISAMIAGAREAWKKVVHEKFGQKIAVPVNDSDCDIAIQETYGYTLLKGLPDQLVVFLQKLGIPNSRKALPATKYEEIPYQMFDQKSQQMILHVASVFRKLCPESDGFPIKFYYSPLGDKEPLAGFAGAGDRQFKDICVVTRSKTELTSDPMWFFMTLVHEMWHCVSKGQHHETSFMTAAEETALALAKKLLWASARLLLDPEDLIPLLPVFEKEMIQSKTSL